jgi:NADH:ubiquinone reductase (H+-translocating)
VILLDAAPRVLPTFAPELSISALKQLAGIGVGVRLGTMVEKVEADGVTLKGGEKIAARTIVWAAGNAASPLGASLGVPTDRQGRVIVREDLSIPGHPEVFVIGDLAHFAKNGAAPLPGLSPVAMQQGRHVARNIRALMSGGWTEPFDYHDKGTMATIGRHAAVADLGRWKFGGFLAWLAWLFVHLIFLVSFRNKLTVLANWAYMYFTFGRGARLITGRDEKSDDFTRKPR